MYVGHVIRAVCGGGRKGRLKGPGETDVAADEVSALAFSPAGDMLAGFTADGTILRVWPLVAGWTQRLQRSSAVILPTKVVGLSLSSMGSYPISWYHIATT